MEHMPSIDKNIPIPTTGKGRARKYAGVQARVEEMEVGDSLFLPTDGSDAVEARKTRAILTSSAWKSQKTSSKLYTTRRVDGGVRMWRVE